MWPKDFRHSQTICRAGAGRWRPFEDRTISEEPERAHEQRGGNRGKWSAAEERRGLATREDLEAFFARCREREGDGSRAGLAVPPRRLDAALELATSRTQQIWNLEAEDVVTARRLVTRHPGLGARDLLHLACCTRRGVSRIRTFDRGLAAAMEG